MERVRFRWRLRALVGLAAFSVLSAGVGGTTASFSAAARHSAPAISFDALSAPADLMASVRGNNVDLAWTPGGFESGAAGSGHRVQAVSIIESDPRVGAEPGGCSSAATFDQSIGRTAGVTTSLTDATPAGSAGAWFCYRVQAEAPAAPATGRWWNLADSPTVLIQIGHVVRSITAVDAGTPGDLQPGDSFVLRFNQPVDSTTGPVSTSGGTPPTAGNDICVHTTSGAIVIGRNSSLLDTNCAASNGHRTGKVQTVAMLPAGQRNAYQATYTWSECALDVPTLCSVLTATVGSRYKGTTDVTADVAGASLTPNVAAGALLTADATALCSAANNASHTCRPAVTGSL